MIAQLSGTVVAAGPTWVVVDLNGFGLRAQCTPATASAVRIGQPATLATSLVVREDSLTLYGFADADERDCFELVQSASGIDVHARDEFLHPTRTTELLPRFG